MIKIGITACFMYPDPDRKIFGPKTLLYMGHDMSHFLSLKGIMPILIPDLPDEKIFNKFLEQMDGFLFQGGLDVSPELYDETPLNFNYEGDPQRDMYEIKILKYALKKEKPILAICRGMQLLNVHLKGTLYQDLPNDNINKVHLEKSLYDENTHEVEFKNNSVLEKIYKNQKCMDVNSVHHQGIKKLGENLLIEAICPDDGLVEAITFSKDGKTSYKNGLVMGIQWHPEFFHSMEAPTIDATPLLDHFILKCKK